MPQLHDLVAAIRMPRKQTVDAIEATTEMLRRHVKSNNRKRSRDVLRVLIQIVAFSYIETLRTPPHYYKQSDFPSESLWDYMREDGRESAFIRFLGFSKWVFELIAERMRPFLRRFDPAARKEDKTRGPKPLYDYIDITAMILRRYQISTDVTKRLECDFFRVDSTLGPYVAAGKEALPLALDDWHYAAVRYLTKQEADDTWEAIKVHHGPPPFDESSLPGPLSMTFDGTTSPVKKDSNNEKQMLCMGAKGHALNNGLLWAGNGTICDYALGLYGTTHDSRASQYLFERLWDTSINPHKQGVIVDIGLKGYCNSGADGRAAVLRPLSSELVQADLYDHAAATSAWLTSVRQYNENGNAALKRSFPFFNRAIDMKDAPSHAKEMVTIVKLFNVRTRIVGYNQIQTQYMKYVDANFNEQLATSTNADDYAHMARLRYEEREAFANGNKKD